MEVLQSKRSSQRFLLFCVIAILFAFSIAGRAQEPSDFVAALQLFNDGENEQAGVLFKQVRESPQTPDSVKFQADIYLAWIAHNLGNKAEVDSCLKRAAMSAPSAATISVKKFIPTLVERYTIVRQTMMIHLRIKTNPKNAQVELRRNREIIPSNPQDHCDYIGLLPGRYDVTISQKGYRPLHLEQGLAEEDKNPEWRFVLEKLSKPLYKKWWVWTIVGGAGIVAAVLSIQDPVLPEPPPPPVL